MGCGFSLIAHDRIQDQLFVASIENKAADAASESQHKHKPLSIKSSASSNIHSKLAAQNAKYLSKPARRHNNFLSIKSFSDIPVLTYSKRAENFFVNKRREITLQSDDISKLKQELQKENCKEVEIGWYKSRDDITEHTGMVITMNGKRKWTIDFGAFLEKNDETEPPLIENGMITTSKYNHETSIFKSNLASMNANQLIDFVEFCINYEDNEKSQNCWTFMIDGVTYLYWMGFTSRDAWNGCLNQIKRIAEVNSKEYVKLFKQELQSSNCKEVDVGFYQRYDYEGGIVVTISANKKFAIDIGTLDGGHEAKMKNYYSGEYEKIRDFDESSSRHEEVLSRLQTKELIEYVTKPLRDENLTHQNLLFFHRSEPEFIKEVTKIMKNEKCTAADIGWYQTVCDIEGGITISINAKVLAMEFIDNKVKFKSYNASDVCCESVLTTLNKKEVINFMEFCMSYEGGIWSDPNCQCTAFISACIDSLFKKNKTYGDEKKERFLYKVNEIKDIEHEHIKRIRREIQNENDRKTKIGWYQIRDMVGHTGIVIMIGEKTKLTLDFQPRSEDRTDAAKGRTRTGIVKLKDYDNSKSILKEHFATLNKKELIKFVKFSVSFGNEHNYNLQRQNCRVFVRDAFHYLRDNDMISNQILEAFLNQMDNIRVKDGGKLFFWKRIPECIKGCCEKK